MHGSALQSSEARHRVKHFLFLYLHCVLFQREVKMRRQTFSKQPEPDAQSCARCCAKCEGEHMGWLPHPLLRLQFTWGQKTLRKQLSYNCTRLGTGGLGTKDLFSTQLLASGGCDLGTSIFLAVTWTGHIHVHVCLSRVRNSESGRISLLRR